MHKKQTVSIHECSDRIEELARRAHETGETFYLTDQSTTLAAIVPVGSKATLASPAALDAAYNAAFPGLPHGMTEDEARRRLRAALNASYQHMADALESAEQQGAKEALAGISGQQI